MQQAKSVRMKVVDALLEGRELNATLFAREIGCDCRSVAKILASVSDALTVRAARSEPGRNRRYYRVKNPAALTRMRAATGDPARPNTPARLVTFDALLDAWGIEVCELDVPGHVHDQMPAEEELFG